MESPTPSLLCSSLSKARQQLCAVSRPCLSRRMHVANSYMQNPRGSTRMATLTKRRQRSYRIASRAPTRTTLPILQLALPGCCYSSKHSLAKMPSIRFLTRDHRLSTRRTHLLLLTAHKLKRQRLSRRLTSTPTLRLRLTQLSRLKTRQRSSVCITWASLCQAWRSSLTGSWRAYGSRIWMSNAATMR